ncbi:MAG: hypothetical protein HYZ26_10175 [Chloroflexi bacterium]|nr:hypothetical protein [Chloroflexota bacterium]
MNAGLLLDWAIFSVSFANTILMAWLGLTVLLTAERRTWGAWLSGFGLLMGAFFFIAHTAILGYGLDLRSQGLAFWWRIGWVPVVGLPFVWYLMTLWYAGYWEDRAADLNRRQRRWFRLTTMLGFVLFAALVVSNPLRSYEQAALLNPSGALAVAKLPVIVVLYPVYSVLSILLSIDALRRPGPSSRVMGELARERARPWLQGVAVIFLFVSLLVAIVMALIAATLAPNALGPPWARLLEQATVLALFDFLIAGLIFLAVLLLGQAVVAYEVFTGQTLPRRGFLRQWRRAIALSVSYGGLVSLLLVLHLREIYLLLLATLLMTAFFALLSWRSYAERERYIEHLRPFVASQGLFDRLVSAGISEAGFQPQVPFEALCRDVLDARVAYLVAWGPMAALAGPPLSFPAGRSAEFAGLAELMAQFASAAPVAAPVDPGRFGGAAWAVPLWNGRGQTGVLLLGEKRDGGLYTQEEIEVAQASGERLVDGQASAEAAQRLMSLQRQRMAESQILDQRARRTLHDEVLPQLHTTLLKLAAEPASGHSEEIIELLTDAHRRISELLHAMPATSRPQVARLGLVGALRQLVDEELGQAFESVHWETDPAAERTAAGLPPVAAETLFYAAREAIRNAARHARAGADVQPLHLKVALGNTHGFQLLIEDDGMGLAAEPDMSGGHGLALHSTLMAVVGGELALESEPGQFTRVRLRFPDGVT